MDKWETDTAWQRYRDTDMDYIEEKIRCRENGGRSAASVEGGRQTGGRRCCGRQTAVSGREKVCRGRAGTGILAWLIQDLLSRGTHKTLHGREEKHLPDFTLGSSVQFYDTWFN